MTGSSSKKKLLLHGGGPSYSCYCSQTLSDLLICFFSSAKVLCHVIANCWGLPGQAFIINCCPRRPFGSEALKTFQSITTACSFGRELFLDVTASRKTDSESRCDANFTRTCVWRGSDVALMRCGGVCDETWPEVQCLEADLFCLCQDNVTLPGRIHITGWAATVEATIFLRLVQENFGSNLFHIRLLFWKPWFQNLKEVLFNLLSVLRLSTRVHTQLIVHLQYYYFFW